VTGSKSHSSGKSSAKEFASPRSTIPKMIECTLSRARKTPKGLLQAGPHVSAPKLCIRDEVTYAEVHTGPGRVT
jgi:hypothetical protein